MKLWICSLREKCLYSEFFWSLFSHIQTEYGEILCISSSSVQIRENTGQKNSEHGHFSRSGSHLLKISLMENFIFYDSTIVSCFATICLKKVSCKVRWIHNCFFIHQSFSKYFNLCCCKIVFYKFAWLIYIMKIVYKKRWILPFFAIFFADRLLDLPLANNNTGLQTFVTIMFFLQMYVFFNQFFMLILKNDIHLLP